VSTVRIGTRGSRLARWQADTVARALRGIAPGASVETVVVRTTGDRIRDRALDTIGEQGLFTREIERSLEAREIDLAVHSLKDLPSELPPGLVLAGAFARADARDAFVSTRHASTAALPDDPVLATGSHRRRALFREVRPHARFRGLRGNIETRLEKLEREGFDGIVMAVAALERLGLGDRVTEALDPERFVPSAGQGAVALEVREDDAETRALASAITDVATLACVRAERAFQRVLEGGCSAAVGAWCRRSADRLVLTGFAGERGGHGRLRDSREGDPTDPEGLGTALGEAFLSRGARDLVGR